MERLLKPERLDIDPSSTSASLEWKHWKRTFENFLAEIKTTTDHLTILINYVSPKIYEIIADCSNYKDALSTLESMFVKSPNEIFARHLLATRTQQTCESLDEFLLNLKILSKDCNFKAADANTYRDESIRDAFITGLRSSVIRQRLLENKTLDLTSAIDQARALDTAMRHSEMYTMPQEKFTASAAQEPISTRIQDSYDDANCASIAAKSSVLCYFCGYSRHPRSRCPARDAVCNGCQKKGHFVKVCKSSSKAPLQSSTKTTATILASAQASSPSSPLSKAIVLVKIKNSEVNGLIDGGSTHSFIHPRVVKRLALRVFNSENSVTMASTTMTANGEGFCIVDMHLNGSHYDDVKLAIIPDLCCDIILGQDFQGRHESVTIQYDGSLPPLVICSVAAMDIEPPELFAYLSHECQPIAARSRRYSYDDRQFIAKEIQHLLSEGIIEPSNSPWRAQVVVTKSSNHKKRLVIDYSETINKYTHLDAFPLPRIDDLVRDVAQYQFFSSIDLCSAYHQVPLKQSDKLYTAFEASGSLYQFYSDALRDNKWSIQLPKNH